ncbi:hypothetical protein ACFL2Q_09135 [Thermodesulfobacteriota bacterium]
MTNIFKKPMNFGWVETALDVWVEIEESNARRAMVRNMAREIVTVCRANRSRVEKAEALLDRYADVIPHENKQEIFLIIAETLLYISCGGIRMKCTEDPKQLLQKGGRMECQ